VSYLGLNTKTLEGIIVCGKCGKPPSKPIAHYVLEGKPYLAWRGYCQRCALFARLEGQQIRDRFST
jgi:hypothetical protein